MSGKGLQIVLDLEANGLKPSRIWAVVCKVVGGSSFNVFTENDVEAFRQFLVEHRDAEFYAHNGHSYDYPVLERLWGVVVPNAMDTLVLSRLADPNRDGGHSLKSWGGRLGFPKGDHTDWTQYSPAMLDYCKRDVELLERVLSVVTHELKDFSKESIELEQEVSRIISQQERNGWLLDVKKCHLLLSTIKERQNEIKAGILERFLPLPKPVAVVEPKYKKDGTLSKANLKFLGDDWENLGGPVTRLKWVPFNFNSRPMVAERLVRAGWEPTGYTDKGSIIVDEKTLEGVAIPEAKLFQEYLMLTKVAGQVTNWLTYVDEDTSRVHGKVNTIGAVTNRMTHSEPNAAQVTSSKRPYGKECRECWTVPEGKKLVGVDASGLELRMLAHYMNDDEYTKELLSGDVHSANQRAAGLPTRDAAKTFIYAFLYGAGDGKIGSIVGGNREDGARLKKRFLSNTPALKSLRERVDAASKRGWLKGVDGRRLHVRSQHAALNTLLQGAGAIVMKKALVLLDEYATKWKIDYKFVGNIHDEIQAEVREDQAEKFGMLAVSCIEAAGLRLNLRCPLTGEYHIGDNWSETH